MEKSWFLSVCAKFSWCFRGRESGREGGGRYWSSTHLFEERLLLGSTKIDGALGCIPNGLQREADHQQERGCEQQRQGRREERERKEGGKEFERGAV